MATLADKIKKKEVADEDEEPQKEQEEVSDEEKDPKEEEKKEDAEEKKKGKAMIHVEGLDEESSYSHVYITAVQHNDLSKLKKKLKSQFLKLDDKEFNADNIEEITDKSFDEEWEELELKEGIDSDEEDLEDIENENARVKQKTGKGKLFVYAFLVMTLAATIQLAFLITIIKEYFRVEHATTDDPERVIIRILAFITLALYLWIELSNGRKIFVHACYHGYLYRNTAKRIGSCFAGLLQCTTSLSCLFCSSQLIVQSESVADCVMNFTALVIITGKILFLIFLV